MQDELNIRWRKTYERKVYQLDKKPKYGKKYYEIPTDDDEDADVKEDESSSSIWHCIKQVFESIKQKVH